jgi:carbon starvation protein CstA
VLVLAIFLGQLVSHRRTGAAVHVQRRALAFSSLPWFLASALPVWLLWRRVTT